MRKCPKCKKWELDVQPEKDYPQEDEEEHYFFRCWNCGFECSKEEAEKKPEKKQKTEQSFFKWVFKKWYFWLIVVADFLFFIPVDNIIMDILGSIAFWMFLFWIVYLFKKKKNKTKK